MRIGLTSASATATCAAAFALFVIACSSSDAPKAPAAGNDVDSGNGATTSRSDSGSSNSGDNDASSSADTSTGGDDGGTPPAPDGGPSLGAYPSGPYGSAAGDVIANLAWVGYVDDPADAVATKKAYGAYSLDDVRRTGKPYAMINLAETYCPGCQKSAGELSTDGKAVIDAGGIVIEVLITTGFTSAPKKTDLDAWINKYAIPVTTVKDPDGAGTPTMTALGGREQAFIIDLKTMKILQVIQGSLSGATDTSGKKGMVAMHQLLGK
jgi:hypothetical protein